jgi:hypothetical protein
MKKIAVVFAIVFIAKSICFSQDDDYMREEAGDYKKKEISGIVTTSATLAFATLGTILMVANKDHTYSNSNGSGASVGFTNGAGGFGLLITLPAPPLLIVGIVKWAKGARYKRLYSTM